MAQNLIACDREQELLLPPSLREWRPEGHRAWFVLDAAAEMALGAFYAGYRDDGWGRAAHDPTAAPTASCVADDQQSPTCPGRGRQRARVDGPAPGPPRPAAITPHAN